MTITKITATETFKKNGSFKGYRYDAHFADGHTEIARASATRLYDFAFQFSAAVNGSARTVERGGKGGIAPYFLFGKKAPSQAISAGASHAPIATFKIDARSVLSDAKMSLHLIRRMMS